MPDSVKMDVREFISLTAKKFGVPETFYSAIFGIESGWNPGIHDSPKGAMGIGQLMPATARGLGVNPRDPAQNIYGSLKLQRKLLDKYRGITGDEDKAWILAAAAYNAGEGAVEKHGGVPPYKETQGYVRHLIKEMKKARKGGVRPELPQPQPIGSQQKVSAPPELSPDLVPGGRKVSLPSIPEAITQSRHGLTPPPTRGGVRGFLDDAAKGGPPGLFSEDTQRAFVQGIVGAGGSLAADFGFLSTHPLGSPAGYLISKGLQQFGAPKVHPAQKFGERIERGVAQDIEEKRAPDAAGRVRQGVARGLGMSLVEIPKLMAGGVALKAATLPTFGAVSGARTGGIEGAARGAAMGAVYHYGGQVTGQFLGKVGNNLVWIAGPAAEQHFVGGKPLDEAIAENVAMGVFAGSGGNRAKVELPNGQVRNARVTDIPKIASGKIKLAEPNQVVMWDMAQRARHRIGRLVAEEGGFIRLRDDETGREVSIAENESELLSEKLDHHLATLADIVNARPENYLTPQEKALAAIVRLRQIVDTHRAEIRANWKFGSLKDVLPGGRGLLGLGERRDTYNRRKSNAYHREREALIAEIQSLSKSAQLPVTVEGGVFKELDWMERLADWAVTVPIESSDQATIKAFENIKSLAKIFEGREGGFARMSGGEAATKGVLARLPKTILPDLATLGAFHYEAGTRTPEDWTARMLGELKETQETVSPTVFKQLGEVFERSKALYNDGTAPTFVSGLKQSLREGLIRGTLNQKEPVPKFLDFIKKAGFADEAKDSGLLKELAGQTEVDIPTALQWLDEKGVIIDVVKGGAPGTKGALYKAGQRAPFVTAGSRDYHEGVIVSNKAGSLWLGPDDYHHMGFRPDQVSWYRGTILGGEAERGIRYMITELEHPTRPEFYITNDVTGEPIKGPYDTRAEAEQRLAQVVGVQQPIHLLEEVQSKRAQLARKKGIVEDPNNAHARLISLEQEWSRLDGEARRMEDELQLDIWDASDEYGRYTPSDDYSWVDSRSRGIGSSKELDKARLRMEQLRSEINELEAATDLGPVPWAPHLTSWYEPALKAYLRDVAERAEPDVDGNVRISWTSATEQAERGNLFKVLRSISAKQRADGNYDLAAVDHTGKGLQWYNIPQARLETYVGKSLADSIVESKGRLNNIGWQEFDARDAKFGGEWAVPLYGDSLENIKKNWPDRPNLERFAWRASGNESTVGQFFEKYARQWGGRVALVTKEAYEIPDFPTNIKVPETIGLELIMPEQMRQVLLKQGQVSYGKRLPDVPKSVGYGLRNRITPEESAEAARQLIARKHRTVGNLITGQRVPDPGTERGGFIRFDLGTPRVGLDDLYHDQSGLGLLVKPKEGQKLESELQSPEGVKGMLKLPEGYKVRVDMVDDTAIIQIYDQARKQDFDAERRLARLLQHRFVERPEEVGGLDDSTGAARQREEVPIVPKPAQGLAELSKFLDEVRPNLKKKPIIEDDIQDLGDIDSSPKSKLKEFLDDEEGSFPRVGSRKPVLDSRVKTDVDTRGRDTAGVGVFFRSPSRWMRGFKDSRIDWIADRMFDAEVREHDFTTEWGRRFGAIVDSLNAATFARGGPRKLLGRKEDAALQQKTFSDFIDLVEKDFYIERPGVDASGKPAMIKIRNAERRSSNPLIQRALEEHDKLAADFKDYLIQSYADRGIVINDPENWGISEKGYFRHLFPGEDNVFMDGDYQGTAQTYVDAIKMANDLMTANPTANVEIKRRPIQFVDPSIRVSTKSFERLVRETLGTLHDDGYIHVTARDVRADYVGLVGKKENIGKFFAAALKREGYEGYLRDYEQVMRAHYFQLARSQELSKLRKDITPTLEELKREGLRGAVEGIERHIEDLWGRPLAYEKAVGGFIRKFPALRERIANPDLGLEIMVRKVASMHNILKLRFNPKAMFVNRIQPLRTLWPYLTNKDMWEVIKRYRDPKWRQDMTELGVMSGAVKLETGGSRVEGFGAREFIKDPFTYVSGTNRALGYTAGIVFAERQGLTGYDAHKLGMQWAAKVEFDNSKWDAPRFLRHSAGQLFGQYKGFLVKDIENTIEIFSRQSTDSPTHPGLSKASRVGKWFLGTAAFGGLRAATSPLPWLGTAAGYSMYLGAAALIKATTDNHESPQLRKGLSVLLCTTHL